MSKRLVDLLVTAVGPLSWGTSYLVATEFMPAGRPLLVALLRVLPAGLLLLAICRQMPKGVWWGRALVLGALNFGIFFSLLFVAAYRLPGGVAAMFGGAQPLLFAGLAWVLLRERPSRAALAAGVFGCIGVSMVVLGPASRLDTVGVLAGLGSIAAMALGTVLARKWGRPAPLPVFTAWQLVAGGLLLIPLVLLVEGPAPALNGRNLLGAAYLGLIGTALAYALWFRGVERLGTRVSFLLLLSPLMALFLGIVVLGQTLTLVQVGGCVLVFASIYMGQRPTAAPAKSESRKEAA